MEKWVKDWFFSDPKGMYEKDVFLYKAVYQRYGQQLKRREQTKVFFDSTNYTFTLPEYILY